jgi:DNA-binding response OmpR family regulator
MKVLLIDDADDIRKIAGMSLRHIGQFAVEEADCAKNGLEKMRMTAPDVVLLDMMMPDMDGMDVLRIVRADAQLCQIPVIFMTARVQSAEVAHYLELGASGVIEKPFDPLTLPNEIRAILKQVRAA